MNLPYIKNFISSLGEYPGVYKMIDKDEKLLYIGKAKNLKSRLSDYLQYDRLVPRMQCAIRQIDKIEIVICNTEIDALRLEAALIKKMQPKYNVALKEERSSYFIVIDRNIAEYPSITIMKKYPDEDGTHGKNKSLYGPFLSYQCVIRILDIIYKTFLIRQCGDRFFSSRKNPCIEYGLKRCSGPCVKKIDRETYLLSLRAAEDFLTGDSIAVQKILESKMNEASMDLNFEKAIIYKDRLSALRNFYIKQNLGPNFNGDYVALVMSDEMSVITVTRVRGGVNWGSNNYFIELQASTRGECDCQSEILLNFFTQFFFSSNNCGPSNFICMNILPSDEDIELINSVIKLEYGHNVKIIKPLRGRKNEIINLSLQNAQEALRIKLNSLYDSKENYAKLAQIVSLTSINTVEVYDNSHISGNHAIAAVIVAGPNGFDKKSYRAYNVKTTDRGDDYQMLREILKKRFGKGAKLPDLFIIDGGVGQLSVAHDILKAIRPLEQVNIISISKGPNRNAGMEKIHFINGEPLELEHNNKLLHFLQRLRDEAHRYAISKHRTKRQKDAGVMSAKRK